MPLQRHDPVFAGRPVADYRGGAIGDPSAAVRLALDEDEAAESIRTIEDRIDELVNETEALLVRALVIGLWSADEESDCASIYAKLCSPEVLDALGELEALFVGDIIQAERQISWIRQADVTSVLKAYSRLQVFRVRGGEGLSLAPFESRSLRSITVESGGLDRSVIAGLSESSLPSLERLELWLGSENYGANHAVDDLLPLLSGRLFSRLVHLGLRDCQYTDDVVIALAHSPLLRQLETLDLSMGTFGDQGARALMDSPYARSLATIDVTHHFMSPRVAEALSAALPNVRADKPRSSGSNRYVQVAE
jgi:hypothetical protein